MCDFLHDSSFPLLYQKIFKKPRIESGLLYFMINIDTLTKNSLHLKFSSTHTRNVMPLYISYDCSVHYLECVYPSEMQKTTNRL